MRFRPCIDIHKGTVKQIVGSTLRDDSEAGLVTNFESAESPAFFADLYRSDDLPGGHVIMLGPGNQDAAMEALRAFPGGLQVGGGLTPENSHPYLDAGASHVIMTSYVFSGGQVNRDNLRRARDTIGAHRLVLDLSCKRQGDDYFIVTDRWQKFTSVTISPATLDDLSGYCDEFLVHAADVEGKRQGIDTDLVRLLGTCSPIAVTYAGGIREIDDLEEVRQSGADRVDATIGSALDIFGGTLRYADVVRWQRAAGMSRV